MKFPIMKNKNKSENTNNGSDKLSKRRRFVPLHAVLAQEPKIAETITVSMEGEFFEFSLM